MRTWIMECRYTPEQKRCGPKETQQQGQKKGGLEGWAFPAPSYKRWAFLSSYQRWGREEQGKIDDYNKKIALFRLPPSLLLFHSPASLITLKLTSAQTPRLLSPILILLLFRAPIIKACDKSCIFPLSIFYPISPGSGWAILTTHHCGINSHSHWCTLGGLIRTNTWIGKTKLVAIAVIGSVIILISPCLPTLTMWCMQLFPTLLSFMLSSSFSVVMFIE